MMNPTFLNCFVLTRNREPRRPNWKLRIVVGFAFVMFVLWYCSPPLWFF